MKQIAFLVPSTSRNRDWEELDDTYLYKYLLPSITPLCKDFKIKVFIGIDDDDKLYTNINYLPQFYPPYKCDEDGVKFELEWVKCSGMKGMPTSVWNHIGHTAISEGFEYLMVLGDDIVCDKSK